MKEYVIYVYSFGITADLLDELGHANYNKLKEHWETARHRLCKFLGFGRKTLRKKLGLALFMQEDSYKYHEELKQRDNIFLLPHITLQGASTLLISFKAIRNSGGTNGLDAMKVTNEIQYRMVLVDLNRNRRPVRIPKTIIRSIERFNTQQNELMSPMH